MNPFALTPSQWRRAALWGTVSALTYLALTFGEEFFKCFRWNL
jgi:hypothetical protein